MVVPAVVLVVDGGVGRATRKLNSDGDEFALVVVEELRMVSVTATAVVTDTGA